MLPDLDADTEIVTENLLAAQAIYFAYALEQTRLFQVVDRIAQLFQQGLLPLGRGAAAQALHRYVTAPDRLSAQARAQLYARVLGARGAPAGTAGDFEPNPEFLTLWLRFLVSVAMFARERDADAAQRAQPTAASRTTVRRAARELAANLSAHVGALTLAVSNQLAAELQAAVALLRDPEILQAFGARDPWQLIDRVSQEYLGEPVNVVRFLALAQAGSDVLRWLAEHADALRQPTGDAPGAAAEDAALLQAAEAWLAASGAADISAKDSAAGDIPQLSVAKAASMPTVDLAAAARELLRALGLAADAHGRDAPAARGVLALFHGAPGTGKTLAAHVIAEALSRDIVRVDLAQVASKHIGETEKNLGALIARAERSGAVLLLDDADVLFGERTDVKDTDGRHANLDIGDLLRRIEAFSGIVILATNVERDTDDAVLDEVWRRRLRQVLRFPRPHR